MPPTDPFITTSFLLTQRQSFTGIDDHDGDTHEVHPLKSHRRNHSTTALSQPNHKERPDT